MKLALVPGIRHAAAGVLALAGILGSPGCQKQVLPLCPRSGSVANVTVSRDQSIVAYDVITREGYGLRVVEVATARLLFSTFSRVTHYVPSDFSASGTALLLQVNENTAWACRVDVLDLEMRGLSELPCPRWPPLKQRPNWLPGGGIVFRGGADKPGIYMAKSGDGRARLLIDGGRFVHRVVARASGIGFLLFTVKHAPDGRVLYRYDSLAGTDVEAVPGTPGAPAVALSPSAQKVAILTDTVSGHRELQTLLVAGPDRPRSTARVDGAGPLWWSQDSRFVALSSGEAVSVVEVDTGTVWRHQLEGRPYTYRLHGWIRSTVLLSYATDLFAMDRTTGHTVTITEGVR